MTFYSSSGGVGARGGSAKINNVFKDKKVRELVLAATRGEVDKIDSLVREGVDVSAVQKDGMSSLLWVVCQDPINLKGLEALLKHGANPNYIPSQKNSELYGLSVVYFLAGQPDIHSNVTKALDLVLKYGGNPNIINPKDHGSGQWQTALICSAQWRRINNMRVLLKHGADIDKKDKTGMTALVWAAFDDRYNAAYFLLQHGANYSISAYMPGSEMDPKYRDKLTRVDLPYIIGLSLHTGIGDKEIPWREKVIKWLEARGVPRPKPRAY